MKSVTQRTVSEQLEFFVESLRILGQFIVEAAFDFNEDDPQSFFDEPKGYDEWLDREAGFPFTDCHNCGGDIGTPRKWIAHVHQEEPETV